MSKTSKKAAVAMITEVATTCERSCQPSARVSTPPVEWPVSFSGCDGECVLCIRETRNYRSQIGDAGSRRLARHQAGYWRSAQDLPWLCQGLCTNYLREMPSHFPGHCLERQHFLFFALGQLFHLLDLVVGELLQLVQRAALFVFGDLFLLHRLLDHLVAVAADI